MWPPESLWIRQGLMGFRDILPSISKESRGIITMWSACQWDSMQGTDGKRLEAVLDRLLERQNV